MAVKIEKPPHTREIRRQHPTHVPPHKNLSRCGKVCCISEWSAFHSHCGKDIYNLRSSELVYMCPCIRVVLKIGKNYSNKDGVNLKAKDVR